MKQRSEFLYVTSIQDSSRLLCYFWCPGCEDAHNYWVQDPNKKIADPGVTLWTWNGDLLRPTFQPSLLLHSHDTLLEDLSKGQTPRCHLFITDGVIDFLGDCTHHLAGQKVPMALLPLFMRDENFGGDEEE